MCFTHNESKTVTAERFSKTSRQNPIKNDC